MIKHRLSLTLRGAFTSKTRDDWYGFEDISPPPSPYPGQREPLPKALETELKLACKQLVLDNIPSDMYDADAKPSDRDQTEIQPDPSATRTRRSRALSGAALRLLTRSSLKAERSGASLTSAAPNVEAEDAPTAEDHEEALPAGKRASQLSTRRTRAESTGEGDQSTRPINERPRSKTYSIIASFAFPIPNFASKTVRQSMSFDNLSKYSETVSDRTTTHGRGPLDAANSALESRRARTQSYHPFNNADHEISSAIEAGLGKEQRRSWYTGLVGREQENKKDDKKDGPSRSRAATLSAAPAIAETVPEAIDPGSPHGSSVYDDSAAASRRSSASSGVMPSARRQTRRFSWKNFRISWSSFRDASDDEGDGYRNSRLSFRKSGSSFRDRRSTNLSDNVPPVPTLAQSKTEQETSQLKNANGSGNASGSKRRSVESSKNRADRNSVGATEKRKTVEMRSSREFKRFSVDRRRSGLQLVQETDPVDQVIKAITESATLPEEAEHKQESCATATVNKDESVTSPQTNTAENPPRKNLVIDVKAKTKRSNSGLLGLATPSDTTPTDSIMNVQLQQATSVTLTKAVADLAPLRAPPTKALPAPPKSSLTQRRASAYSWLPSEVRPPPDLGRKRPNSMAMPSPSKRASFTSTAGSSDCSLDTQTFESRMNRVSTLSTISGRSMSLPMDLSTGNHEDEYSDEESIMGMPSTIRAPGTEANSRRLSTIRQGSAIPRSDSVDDYNSLQSAKYLYADDIETLAEALPGVLNLGALKKKSAKVWPFASRRQKTWMDELEKLGIKDGVLMVDQLDGPPIVRY